MRKHLNSALARVSARAMTATAAVCLLATTALADPIAALDHPEYAERERASERLLEAAGGDLKKLEAMAKERELTPEQRARLEAIGWEIFRRGPRAAMGVQFGGRDVARGVRIGGTVQGFDAANVLAADDIILEINGQELDSIDTMRFLIVARDPGDVVRLKVQRRGPEIDEVREGPEIDEAREIDVSVRMGSFGQLDQPGEIGLDVLEGAWRIRLGEWPSPDERSASEARLDGPPPALNPFVRVPGYDRWLADGEPMPPRLTNGGEPTGGLSGCGRLRVRVADRDLLMPPVRYGIDALRMGERQMVVETVRVEFSQISQAIGNQIRSLRDQMTNADAETRERLAEEMRRLDERSRSANNRANEIFDLYDRMPRGGR
ncbi:MAG: PDZ domain-containing protein [Phycisphaerales bacterium]|nr:PDZ domain-containing protein [Phycisphaerales bacterium]